MMVMVGFVGQGAGVRVHGAQNDVHRASGVVTCGVVRSAPLRRAHGSCRAMAMTDTPLEKPVLRAPPRVQPGTMADIQSRRVPDRIPDLPHAREVERAERARDNQSDSDDDDGNAVNIKGPVMTECGQCKAIYEIEPAVLGRKGSRVKCEVCSHVWFQQTRALKPLVVPDGKKLVDYPEEMIREVRENSRAGRRSNNNNNNNDRRRDGGGRNGSRGPQHTVFLGNLPFSVDENQLEDLCRGKATVTSIKVVRDDGGRPRGFAFVNVSTADEVEKLVGSLQGIQMNGREINARSGNRNS